jgi:DNA-binding PadR family transcriptional regulator
MELIGPTKKRILLELEKEPAHGYKLASDLTLPLSTIYGHLRDLRELGLVEKKTQERQMIYTLTEKGKKLMKIIEER